LKKEQAATLLNSPLDIVAEGKGFKRLVRIKDGLGAYQGIVGATKRDTARRKRESIIAFMRAFHASVAWLADPANKEEALSILIAKMSGMERPLAEKAYAVLLDPHTGIYRDMRIDREGMKTVLRLRSAYAQPKKELSNPDRYIDETLLATALKQ
jgi:hypothetical protein